MKKLLLSFLLILCTASVVCASMPSVDEAWNSSGQYTGPLGPNVKSQGGSTPTCTASCGTGYSIIGTNSAMTVFVGNAPATPLVITFGNAFTAVPVCTVTYASGTAPTTASPTTTNISVAFGSGPSNGTAFSVLCVGK